MRRDLNCSRISKVRATDHEESKGMDCFPPCDEILDCFCCWWVSLWQNSDSLDFCLVFFLCTLRSLIFNPRDFFPLVVKEDSQHETTNKSLYIVLHVTDINHHVILCQNSQNSQFLINVLDVRRFRGKGSSRVSHVLCLCISVSLSFFFQKESRSRDLSFSTFILHLLSVVQFHPSSVHIPFSLAVSQRAAFFPVYCVLSKMMNWNTMVTFLHKHSSQSLMISLFFSKHRNLICRS
jgi:hypothetical protein